MIASTPQHPAMTDNGRDETDAVRLDRNWTEILQELRVIQTGTQILSGFLLTLAFQPRFAQLDAYQDGIYLGLVILAATTTTLGLAPVSLHRALFRKHAKSRIVAIGDRLLRATLVGVALILSGTTLLIFDVVAGRLAGAIAAAATLILLVTLWIVLPRGLKRTPAAPPGAPPGR